ncbi:TolC family protein [Geoalkalibacter sp.]|uniref:TolC family protein n=1 Tax=Geoalkalibacter sp. TaxID=3041440 RepID=UPI00272DFC11|nr:TolC family protein [Geoalkalibacter sp.]
MAMGRSVFWRLLGALLTLPLLGAVAWAAPLTLEQALDRALADNPALAESRARIVQAQAALEESRAAFWPTLDARLEYLRADAPSAYLFKTIDARRLPAEVDFNDPGRFDNLETSLAARLNLYSGGQDRLRRDQADLRLEQARQGSLALENDLRAAVADTFLALLTARDLVDIARQSVLTLEREVELAQVRFAGGGLLRSEWLSLEVRLAEARRDEVRARAAERRLQAALGALLGVGTDVSWEPVDSPSDFIPPPDCDAALRLARRQRPELARAAQDLEIARLEQGVARAAYLPRLDLEARLYHDDPDLAYDDNRLNWTLGAQLNWNLFSGFATRARQAQAAGKRVESSAALRRLSLEIELEVRHAWLALEEAAAVEAWAEAARVQAKQAFAQVQTRFAGGAAEVTRYLEAELALNRSRVNAASAGRDRQRALFALARALGAERTPAQASPENSFPPERQAHGSDP